MREWLAAAACVMVLSAACDTKDNGPGPPLTSGTTSGAGGAGGDPCPDEPSCGPGQAPFDEDGDGCGDRCCFGACGADMVLVDDNGDGCFERCGDAPCTVSDDCETYDCFILQNTCDDPIGVCSDVACMGVPGGCGCDGNTYSSACEAVQAGVGLDLSGDACQ